MACRTLAPPASRPYEEGMAALILAIVACIAVVLDCLSSERPSAKPGRTTTPYRD